jgi:hypothetical protein
MPPICIQVIAAETWRYQEAVNEWGQDRVMNGVNGQSDVTALRAPGRETCQSNCRVRERKYEAEVSNDPRVPQLRGGAELDSK